MIVKWVICDLDGTLCHISPERLELINRKDYDAFNEACGGEEPSWSMRELLLAAHDRGHAIAIVTARSEVVREKTLAWLNRYAIPHTLLLMRPEGNHDHDHELKKQMYHNAGLTAEEVLFVMEDRPCVTKMWRELGLLCLQVNEGVY